MNLLLDTNALVWASDELKKRSLGKQAWRLIETGVLVYFSTISLAELQIKALRGKFKSSPDIEKAVAQGFLPIDFTAEHAQAIENFPGLVRHDPFDRMILAQAYSEGLSLLTADETLLSLGLSYVVDARE